MLGRSQQPPEPQTAVWQQHIELGRQGSKQAKQLGGQARREVAIPAGREGILLGKGRERLANQRDEVGSVHGGIARSMAQYIHQ